MSKIIEDFKKYRDVYGLNHSHTHPGQNGTLFTLEYLINIHLNYQLENDVNTVELLDEYDRIDMALNFCVTKDGLLARYPNGIEFNSMDNYTAMLVYDYIRNGGDPSRNWTFSKKLKNHGETVICTGVDNTQGSDMNKKFYPIAKLLGLGKAKNYFNHVKPEEFCFFSWFGRSPGFMGLIDICATGNTTFFRKLCLFIGQLVPIFEPKSQDGWKLTFLTWQVLGNRNLLWETAYDIWKHFLYRNYKEGMKTVYEQYYGVDHPQAKYFPAEIE